MRKSKRSYTPEEVERLKFLFSSGKSDREIASIMGRGAESVRKHRHQLKLLRPTCAQLAAQRHREKWTDFKLTYIRNNWRSMSDEAIAKKLKVSVNEYRLQRRSMTEVYFSAVGDRNTRRLVKSIRKGSKLTWTYSEEAMLEDLYPTTSTRQLAKMLGKTEPAIRQYAAKKKIRKKGYENHKGRLRRWTPEEDELLRTQYPTTNTRELAQLLGRSCSAVNHRAFRLKIRKEIIEK